MRNEFRSYCHEGSSPWIVINNRDNMTLAEHLAVLQRIRRTIETADLWAEDDTTTGSKNTECNWGMCGDLAEHYPEANLHTFPQDFVDRGRVSPLDPPAGFACPMREDGEASRWGCFYACRVFQHLKNPPNREEALKRFDREINRVKEGNHD